MVASGINNFDAEDEETRLLEDVVLVIVIPGDHADEKVISMDNWTGY